MNREIKYKTYQHKKTEKIVQAIKFKLGMEDGKKQIQNQHKSYVLAWDNGIKQNMFITENDYIVINEYNNKKYKFIFNKKTFLKFYKLKKEEE